MGGVLSLSPMVDSTKSSKMPRFLTFQYFFAIEKMDIRSRFYLYISFKGESTKGIRYVFLVDSFSFQNLLIFKDITCR